MKRKVKLYKSKAQFILDSINALVIASGYPATHEALVTTKLAKSCELRKLVEQGKLLVCAVQTDDGTMKTYYTEGAVPDVVKYQFARPDQSAASEVDHESGRKVRS